MAPRGRKRMAQRSMPRSILPPPPSQRPTLQLPTLQTNTEALRELLNAGESPTTSEWPEAPKRYAYDLDEPTVPHEDWRPTPPAFVVPEVPGKGNATLTLIRGFDAGRVFRLARQRTLIGRGVTADIQIDDEAVSRCHCSVTRRDGDHYLIEDLGSTNGTYVRGRSIKRCYLSPGDRVQLGPNVALRFALLAEDEGTLQENLFESAVRDGLTGVFNRVSLTKLIDEALREARSEGISLSVLMVDLDHFKQVNDDLGHAVGDDVLRAVADVMKHVVRTQDSVARYGGEEFVVLARATHRAEACRLAERLRQAIASVRVPSERGTAMTTASIGVASLAECRSHCGTELLRLADERMYEAKKLGRNCVYP